MERMTSAASRRKRHKAFKAPLPNFIRENGDACVDVRQISARLGETLFIPSICAYHFCALGFKRGDGAYSRHAPMIWERTVAISYRVCVAMPDKSKLMSGVPRLSPLGPRRRSTRDGASVIVA
jgi:hypothetical protein